MFGVVVWFYHHCMFKGNDIYCAKTYRQWANNGDFILRTTKKPMKSSGEAFLHVKTLKLLNALTFPFEVWT